MKKDTTTLKEIHRLAKNLLAKDILDAKEVRCLDEQIRKVLAENSQPKRYFRRIK
jgi:hypothetical protein